MVILGGEEGSQLKDSPAGDLQNLMTFSDNIPAESEFVLKPLGFEPLYATGGTIEDILV